MIASAETSDSILSVKWELNAGIVQNPIPLSDQRQKNCWTPGVASKSVVGRGQEGRKGTGGWAQQAMEGWMFLLPHLHMPKFQHTLRLCLEQGGH